LHILAGDKIKDIAKLFGVADRTVKWGIGEIVRRLPDPASDLKKVPQRLRPIVAALRGLPAQDQANFWADRGYVHNFQLPAMSGPKRNPAPRGLIAH